MKRIRVFKKIVRNISVYRVFLARLGITTTRRNDSRETEYLLVELRPSCGKNLEARDLGARGHVPTLLESMHDERGYITECVCVCVCVWTGATTF